MDEGSEPRDGKMKASAIDIKSTKGRLRLTRHFNVVENKVGNCDFLRPKGFGDKKGRIIR
jgi:hypothetical protein